MPQSADAAKLLRKWPVKEDKFMGSSRDLEVVGKLLKVMEYQFDGHYFQFGGQL